MLEPKFRIAMAQSEHDIAAAQRLRYDVFVTELGAGGSGVDHDLRIEEDAFDPFVDHMLLHDDANGRVVGVYRMMRPEQEAAMGRYYSDDEYNLTPLRQSGKRLLELGRSCLHAEYRGGTAMYHLWNGLADYIAEQRIDLLFGVASFHGTDTMALAQPLSLLHYEHLAQADVRPTARAPHAIGMDILPREAVDRRRAMLAVPALIKAYLRLGGKVGEGAFVDQAFNTTDVCLVMDTARINARQAKLYQASR